MTQDEVLKQALEALYDSVSDNSEWIAKRERAVASLRQAIADLESQERNFCPRCGKRTNDIHTCTPPQRTWVGLTKDEVDSWNLPDHPTVFEFAQFIEARLKEKNT